MGADLYLTIKSKPGKKAKEYYYRDSYNETNLLWQFKKDYWDWFRKFMNKNDEIVPRQIQKMLDELEDAHECWETDLKPLLQPKWQRYFEKHYGELIVMLKTAIKNKEKIVASI